MTKGEDDTVNKFNQTAGFIRDKTDCCHIFAYFVPAGPGK